MVITNDSLFLLTICLPNQISIIFDHIEFTFNKLSLHAYCSHHDDHIEFTFNKLSLHVYCSHHDPNQMIPSIVPCENANLQMIVSYHLPFDLPDQISIIFDRKQSTIDKRSIPLYCSYHGS